MILINKNIKLLYICSIVNLFSASCSIFFAQKIKMDSAVIQSTLINDSLEMDNSSSIINYFNDSNFRIGMDTQNLSTEVHYLIISNSLNTENLLMFNYPGGGCCEYFIITKTINKPANINSSKLHFSCLGLHIGDSFKDVNDKLLLRSLKKVKMAENKILYYYKANYSGWEYQPIPAFYLLFKNDKVILIGIGKINSWIKYDELCQF